MCIALVFPGQGSQIPGMLHRQPDHPADDLLLWTRILHVYDGRHVCLAQRSVARRGAAQRIATKKSLGKGKSTVPSGKAG